MATDLSQNGYGYDLPYYYYYYYYYNNYYYYCYHYYECSTHTELLLGMLLGLFPEPRP